VGRIYGANLHFFELDSAQLGATGRVFGVFSFVALFIGYLGEGHSLGVLLGTSYGMIGTIRTICMLEGGPRLVRLRLGGVHGALVTGDGLAIIGVLCFI
jgi:hypothetical protein